MAHGTEPMDIDNISEFDNKENSFHHNNVRQSTEKGYEELDVSELNMKLRYSFTPASSPMTKSYTDSCLDNKSQDSDDLNNTVIHENLTQSLNATVTKNETLVKTPKLLPLQALSADQITDGNRNASVLRPLDGTMIIEDGKNITVTVTEANDSDENISIPSTSSSPVCTPEATTPVKDASKTNGSPIMRGLKTVLNMFRPSQSPIPPDENDIQNVCQVGSPIESDTLSYDITQFGVASTPIAATKKERNTSTSRRSSPLKESVVFNENLEKELQWNDDSTIIFSSKEKIPIHKLLFQPLKPLASDDTIKLVTSSDVTYAAENLETTVEAMDISYSDSILTDKTMTAVQSDTSVLQNVKGITSEIDTDKDESLFLDCESTFSINETELLSDTIDAENNGLKKTVASIVTDMNTAEHCIEEANDEIFKLKSQEIDKGHKEIICKPLPQSIDIDDNLAPLPDNLEDNTPNTPTNESVRSKTIDFIIQSSLALIQKSKENVSEVCLNTDLQVSQQVSDKTLDIVKNEIIDLAKMTVLSLPSDDEFDDAQVFLNSECVKSTTKQLNASLKDTNSDPDIIEHFENKDNSIKTVLNKDAVDYITIANKNTVAKNDETTEVIPSNLPESLMPVEVADFVPLQNTLQPSTPVSLPENIEVKNLTMLTDDTTECLNSTDKQFTAFSFEIETISTTNTANNPESKMISVDTILNLELNSTSEAMPKVSVKTPEIVDNAITENIQPHSSVTKTDITESETIINTESSDDSMVSNDLTHSAIIENIHTESPITDLNFKALVDVSQSVLNSECNEHIKTNITMSESTQEMAKNAIVENILAMSPVIESIDKIVEKVSQVVSVSEIETSRSLVKQNIEVTELTQDMTDNTIVEDNQTASQVLDFSDKPVKAISENQINHFVTNTTQDLKPFVIESNTIDNADTTAFESNTAQHFDAARNVEDMTFNEQLVVQPGSMNDGNDSIPLSNQNYLNNISTVNSENAAEKAMELSVVEPVIDNVNQPMDVTLTDHANEDIKKENDDEIILSESNSPYVSLSVQSDNNREPPVESFEDIRMSPPICSKGYNINFDDLDNVNPFTSKTKVRISPPPGTELNHTFQPIINKLTSTKQPQKVQLKEVIPTALNNTTPTATEKITNVIEDTKSPTEYSDDIFLLNKTSDIKLKNTKIIESNIKVNKSLTKEIVKKVVEEVTDDANSIVNKVTEAILTPLPDAMIQRADPESIEQDYIALNESVGVIATKVQDISSTGPLETGRNKMSSLEQSTYFSAGTSSGDGSEKPGYTLPDFDEMDINPFATKNKMRQSPQPEAEDPFVTESKILRDNSPIAVITETISNDNDDIVEAEFPSKNIRSNEAQMSITEEKSAISINMNTYDENAVTVQEEEEVHTEDEETLEGPFIDSELGDNVDKMSDFESEKVEFNVFTDLPTQEDDENFEAGELFIDADAFELFMNKNKSNELGDNGKDSLFLKFDPLFAKRVNSDGVVDVLSKLQKRQSTPKKMKAPMPPKDLMLLENSPVAGPSIENDGFVTPDESSDDLNVTVSQKPTMAVPPAVNPVITPRKKATTPVRTTSRLSMNFTSPAMAVIDRLLSLSGTFSPENRDITRPQVSGEQYEADRALIQLRELLAEKELNVHHLRGESKELRDRLDILESQMKTLEKEGEKRLKHINELNEKLSEKNKENKGMSAVVEEYERTIAGLISGIEEDRKRHSEERIQLINDRDEQTAHLTSMEVAFSDLHSKYEKSKQVIMSYKAKEDTYKKSIQEFELNLEKMQNNYELLKQHATSKLNHANTELEKINRSHESEVLKLNAMIKRKDLHISSLEETLTQKTKANEELTAICDELINKVG